MCTIEELEIKQHDLEQACFCKIKELVGNHNSLSFNIKEPCCCPYCIGDNYNGEIIDGVIKSIEVDNDNIYVTYIDSKNYYTTDFKDCLQYLIYCNYIELIQLIICNLQNIKK